MSAPDLSGVTGNYFPAVQKGFSDSLNGSITNSSNSMVLHSVTGYTNGDAVFLWIEPGTSNAELVWGIVNTGTLSITSMVRGIIGSAANHSSGATVSQYVSSADHMSMRKGLLVQHNQDGTHKAITAPSATFSNGLTVSGGTVSLPNSQITNAMLAGSITSSKIIGIDKSVLTTDSNPYKFSVYLASNQTGIVDSVNTKVLFDTELFDTNNNFASNKYTAPVNGFYQINFYLECSSGNNNGVAASGYLYKNGSELLRAGGLYPNFGNGTTAQAFVNLSDVVQLTAGDTLEVYTSFDVVSGTASVGGGANKSRFNGFLMSRT